MALAFIICYISTIKTAKMRNDYTILPPGGDWASLNGTGFKAHF